MAIGDVHISGPGGWPLCGASGPLGGFTVTSPPCRDCANMDGRGHITSAPNAPLPPILLSHPTPIAANRRMALPTFPVKLSIILGTVNRPQMLRECITAVRASIGTAPHEIVVAYGEPAEASLPWMTDQRDIVPVLGGMNGAIDAFNTAYAATRGRLICQINDDVLVDPGSLVRAVQYLDDNPRAAGVVFKFDKGDGRGYRHDDFLAPCPHPNQMVVRRSTCEAVIDHLGAFWGDADHRTNQTYGGDSAFGVICYYLGLHLASVDGVTCRDLEVKDALRDRNNASRTHVKTWWQMFEPYLGR